MLVLFGDRTRDLLRDRRIFGVPTECQVLVCNVKYVLDRVNLRDGYPMKKATTTRVKRKRRSSSITRCKLTLDTL
jgi:hypothetical protein